MTLRGMPQRLHRWLGMTLGLWFAFLGISGSILVFWHALEDQAYPETVIKAEGAPLPLETLLARLAEARPQADIFRIHLPERPGAAIRLDFFDPIPGSDAVSRSTAFMHPVTGDLLGERRFGEAWVHTLYSLHSGLILGRSGVVAAGLMGLGLGLLALLGLWLWTYRDGRPFSESLAPQPGWRGLRRLRNWHRVLGIWAAAPLILAAMTGACIAFPETLREVARPLLGGPRSAIHPGPAAPGLGAAMAQAESHLPGFRVIWIDLPLAGSKAATAFILRPADGRLSGTAVAETSLALGKGMQVTLVGPVETLRAWIMALHNGHAMGLAHRLFIVALGLVPAVMGGLGWLAWRRRARARQVARLPDMAGGTQS
jgi:uncharacterized iron-regulated membrane protein